MKKAIFPITQDKFYSPILGALIDGKTRPIDEIRKKLTSNFHLTDKELDIRLPSGEERVFTNRFRWAKNDLIRYGYIEAPAIGQLKITSTGLKLFKQKKS